jgi:hypothetical protein
VIDTRPTFLSAVSWHIIRYWLLLAKITILFHFTKAFAEKMITGTDQNRPRDQQRYDLTYQAQIIPEMLACFGIISYICAINKY